ncbi:MAG: TonB-dependent receptor [Bacteroidia bacterium]|nr:TonB-dependent receptor [Bacteroidia bacterium]
MKRFYHIALLSAFYVNALPIASSAQTIAKDSTMTRTVVVEQEYTPILSDASKITVLPKVETPIVTKKQVEYATGLAPAVAIQTEGMQAYVSTKEQGPTNAGYARMGYGNYGQLDLFGNYLFKLSQRDHLNLRLLMDGRDGTLTLPANGGDWKSYFYRTEANLTYRHQFNAVDLTVGGDFGVSNFNFIPNSLGKQKLTAGDIHVGVQSANENNPLRFAVEGHARWYERQNNPGYAPDATERQIQTKGFVSGSMNEEQGIHIDFNLTHLAYSKSEEGSERLFQSRTLVDFTPYYELKNDNWSLQAGAHVDLSFSAGKFFRLAPHVKAQYVLSDHYLIYGQATGGRFINDFRRLEEVCPYASPLSPINDSYEQLQSTIGFKISPTNGLWFNLYGGYQSLKDEWYQNPTLYTQPTVGLTTPSLPAYSILDLKATNATNTFIGLRTTYSYKESFSLSAEGEYRHWSTDHSATELAVDPLFLKPEVSLKLQTDFRPLPNLLIQTGYKYTGWSGQAKAISNLYLGGNYALLKGISIYARFDNLLNKTYQYHWGYPTEGFNLVGGLSFKF